MVTPPKREKHSATRRERQHNRVAYMFLLPWLIGFFCLTLGPLLTSLYLAFTDYDLLSRPNWIGLQNFREMFTGDYRYLTSLRVTFTYVAFSVPIKLACALLVALALHRGLRGLAVYRALYYIPSLVGSSVAVAILWRYLFSGDGLINQALALFGVRGLNWVASPDYALGTLVLLAAWQFGAPMVIFLAGLNQIPRAYYDAAKVDGAGRVAVFFRITFPLLTPVLFFNLVLEVINSFKAFTPAFIVSGGNGGPVDATLFYTLYLYQQGFGAFNMGYASAMAWVLLVIIALFTALIVRSSSAWVFYQES